MKRAIPFMMAAVFACAAAPCRASGPAASESLGHRLPIWSIIPFLGILLSIALFPLIGQKNPSVERFWERHFGEVSAFWGLLLLIPFLAAFGLSAFSEFKHMMMIDYIPFIILLLALFTVSSGILVEGRIRGTPGTNAMMLLIGTVIASCTGTTGASMLMIRPVLRSNIHRRNKAHVVVFFIFLVSNIGGLLTPLGDPPLFLGFLHGVPFFWTLSMLPILCFTVAVVLAVFFAMDSILYRKELAENATLRSLNDSKTTVRLSGSHNLLYLAGIVGAVLMSGIWKPGEWTVLGVPVAAQNILRDVLLIVLAALSFRTTRKEIHQKNEFSWRPMEEVAVLFAGIFVTIIPAILMLKAGAEGPMGFIIRAVQRPSHYFWAAGGLSSFLDNAPTYLTFFNTALGNFYAGIPETSAVPRLIAEKAVYLKAIAAGAVFMGANTYIGNAPNFMVKTIAEEKRWGVAMPHFFGYMGYSMAILIPTFILVTLFFF
jgi:Na+/H+ antiporter NhaD/arsenite permease-like protein